MTGSCALPVLDVSGTEVGHNRLCASHRAQCRCSRDDPQRMDSCHVGSTVQWCPADIMRLNDAGVSARNKEKSFSPRAVLSLYPPVDLIHFTSPCADSDNARQPLCFVFGSWTEEVATAPPDTLHPINRVSACNRQVH